MTILHFNDVYDIFANDEEPVGGAARFCKAVKDVKGDPLILFSGDCLNPSTLSAFTKGSHMPPVLNHIGVHVASLGNHDFDFGIEELEKRMGEFNFPWLLSNVLDKRTGTQLANAQEFIELEWAGQKLGLIGLVEKEWLMTIPSIDVDEDVVYEDFVAKGQALCDKLKARGCDMIIALTHMRAPNDEKLAASVPDIQPPDIGRGVGNLHRTRLGLRGIGRREHDPATRREHERRAGSLTFSVLVDGLLKNPCTARGLAFASVRRRHRPVINGTRSNVGTRCPGFPWPRFSSSPPLSIQYTA